MLFFLFKEHEFIDINYDALIAIKEVVRIRNIDFKYKNSVQEVINYLNDDEKKRRKEYDSQ